MKVSQLCPTLCDSMDYTVHGILQARIIAVGSLSLLQGIFVSQVLNPGLLPCRQILYQLSYQGNLLRRRYYAYFFYVYWIFFVQYLQELIVCATHFGRSTLGIYLLT